MASKRKPSLAALAKSRGFDDGVWICEPDEDNTNWRAWACTWVNEDLPHHVSAEGSSKRIACAMLRAGLDVIPPAKARR